MKWLGSVSIPRPVSRQLSPYTAKKRAAGFPKNQTARHRLPLRFPSAMLLRSSIQVGQFPGIFNLLCERPVKSASKRCGATTAAHNKPVECNIQFARYRKTEIILRYPMFRKTPKINSRSLRVAFKGFLIAALTSGFASQAAETLFANSGFDADANGWAWENWSAAGSSAIFDPTQSATVAGGAQSSGSLKLINAFTDIAGYQQAVYTIALPAPQNFNGQVGWIALDVKVDPTSIARASGDYGFLEVILRQGNNWDWVTLPGVHLTSTGWQRFAFQVPKDGVDSIRAITVKLGENDFLGPVTLNIDNIAYSTTPEDVFITGADNGSIDVTPDGWSWENWSAQGLVSWDPLDVQGRSTSGSIKLEHDFANLPNDYQQTVFTYVLPSGQVNAASDYSEVNLDVKVDASSTPRATGDYGYFQVYLRNGTGWDWLATAINGADGIRLTNNDWHHLSFKVPSTADATHRLTFKTGDNALLGPITLNIDNISWTRNTTPPPPPTLGLAHARGGLSLVTTSADQYGRHNIYTTDPAAYSFAGATDPVSYSFTIDSFPDAATYPGFQAHIFLVPGAPGAETGPDWNEPTLMFMDIKAGANNSGNATFRPKLDEANGNNQLYAAGLTTVNSATVVGTWTLTIDPNANTATMTAPDGTVSNPIDISALAPEFADGNLRVYFGDQPNADANKGQSIHVAKIQIKSGSTVLLSDDFSGSALNTDLWTVNATAGGVQFVSPSDAGWIVNWTLPDTNYKLQVATKLTAPDWTDVDVSASTTLIGSVKQVIVTKSTLPTSDNVFFRLIQPAPTP